MDSSPRTSPATVPPAPTTTAPAAAPGTTAPAAAPGTTAPTTTAPAAGWAETTRPARASRPSHAPEAVTVHHGVEDTPVGRLLLVAHPDGRLLLSAFAPDETHLTGLLEHLSRRATPHLEPAGARLDTVRRQLSEYFSGQRRTFDLPVDLSLTTPFQRQVLEGLRDLVPYGTTTTYGGLATALGRPGAGRAVGSALGANPLCVVLPCHRVIASDGALTGYAGGVQAKRHLLHLEQSPV